MISQQMLSAMKASALLNISSRPMRIVRLTKETAVKERADFDELALDGGVHKDLLKRRKVPGRRRKGQKGPRYRKPRLVEGDVAYVHLKQQVRRPGEVLKVDDVTAHHLVSNKLATYVL